jgi:predicted small secreted protein
MRRTTALALLIVLPCTLLAGCDALNPLTGGCDDTALEAGKYDYNVTVQYRVEVVDTQGAQVDGANVRVTYHKVHCNGNLSSQDVDEGTTGANGVFTNALRAIKRSYHINNEEDLVVMGLTVQKGGWIHQESRTYEEDEMVLLPNKRINQQWKATYDGS